MSRKRKPVEHANHERWLISYADFITLLFAFFVVMFASSVANKDKARMVSAAVEKALSGVAETTDAPASLDKKARPVSADPGDLMLSLQLLEKQLASEISSGKMRLALQERGLVVTLNEAGFFEPGADTIQPASEAAFQKVASALRRLPNPVRLEGHTDATPIHNLRFNSNWDLSTSRAVAVLALLEDTYGISRGRLSAAGYADTVPVEPNDTETGRARNRRVDLVILSVSGMAGFPEAPSHALAASAPRI